MNERATLRRGLAAAAAVLAIGLVAGGCSGSAHPDQSNDAAYSGARLTDSPVAHDFALRDQNGKLVRLSDQRGHWVLLTFLYTHCTDVCPLIANNLNSAVRDLAARGNDVRVLAVSVDPKGDTPAGVKNYIRRHHLSPQFHYLIGTAPKLEQIWIAYNVVSKIKGAGKLFHSSYTFLIDPQGKERIVYSPPAYADTVRRDLAHLIATS